MLDLLEPMREQTLDVSRVAGRADRHHRTRLRNVRGRREHGRAAEAVADQDRGSPPRAPQLVCGCDEIRDIGRKRGVGEFAVARAEPGEVEAQHGDVERREAFRDALGGVRVLAAGEAMSEQRVSPRLTRRTIEQGGELLTLGIGKIETFSRHVDLT